MITISNERIAKVVYFINLGQFDCYDGGYTSDLSKATLYSDEKVNEKILLFYPKNTEIWRVKVTVETLPSGLK
jgi:hypothetical protein